MAPDHDSDTGVVSYLVKNVFRRGKRILICSIYILAVPFQGSMSPSETPHGTWETRLRQNKSLVNGNTSPINSSRCTHCDPDLDYVALLKKEIVDLRKLKAQYTSEINVCMESNAVMHVLTGPLSKVQTGKVLRQWCCND